MPFFIIKLLWDVREIRRKRKLKREHGLKTPWRMPNENESKNSKPFFEIIYFMNFRIFRIMIRKLNFIKKWFRIFSQIIRKLKRVIFRINSRKIRTKTDFRPSHSIFPFFRTGDKFPSCNIKNRRIKNQNGPFVFGERWIL